MMRDHVDRNTWNRGRSVYVTRISDAVPKSRRKMTCRGWESRGARGPITRECGSLTPMPKWTRHEPLPEIDALLTVDLRRAFLFVGSVFFRPRHRERSFQYLRTTPDCIIITRLPSAHSILTIHCLFSSIHSISLISQNVQDFL